MRRRAAAAARLDGRAVEVALFYQFKRRSLRRYIEVKGERRYKVSIPDLACDCPDYLYRRLGWEGQLCKHGQAVKALYFERG